MSNSSKIICFVDIKKSTRLNEQMGNILFGTYRDEFRNASKTLSKLIKGKYIKDTGDGCLVAFDDFIVALQYTAILQQYYSKKPCLEKSPIKIRIGLSYGPVEEKNHDVFGSTVNAASRIEGNARPGTVFVSRSLFSQIKKIYSVPKCKKLFKKEGQYKLRGCKNSELLYSFCWEPFLFDNPKYSIANLVHSHLENASIEMENITVSELLKPSFIMNMSRLSLKVD